MKSLIFLYILPPLFVISGCATVYVIDRHTIMEEEASGQWPEIENISLNSSQKLGPTFFRKEASSKKKQNLLNILNGELTAQKDFK